MGEIIKNNLFHIIGVLIIGISLVGGGVATVPALAMQVEWSVPLTATTDTEGSNLDLELGVMAGATDAYDSGIDIPYPGPPPQATFNAYFSITDPLFSQLNKDYRTPTDSIQWTMPIKSSADDITLTWDVSSVPTDISLSLTHRGLDIDMKSLPSTVLLAGVHSITILATTVPVDAPTGPVDGDEDLPSDSTEVSDSTSNEGLFTTDVNIMSNDGKCLLTINQGTIGLSRYGQPLEQITILVVEEPPPPPDGYSLIGTTYDLGPDGATFQPSIKLTIMYNPDRLPGGVDEEDLVIAVWDEDTARWIIPSGCVVDSVSNAISTTISHFTMFAVAMNSTEAPKPPNLPTFSIVNLKIRPAEVVIGDSVTISVKVVNKGEEVDSYTVILKINGVVEETELITLAAGSSQTVSFTVSKDTVGDYEVEIADQTGGFSVLPIQSSPPSAINWGLIGGIAAAVVVIGFFTGFILRRRTGL